MQGGVADIRDKLAETNFEKQTFKKYIIIISLCFTQKRALEMN